LKRLNRLLSLPERTPTFLLVYTKNFSSVPTWNYIAVYAYGIAKIITFDDSPKSMEKMINEMVDTHEADYKSHWQSLSHGFRESIMNDIVGFKMTVTRLEGKYKLSQNRSQADRQNVSNRLLQNPDPIVRAVGAEMKQNLELDK
jgi:transcriptional regulator